MYYTLYSDYKYSFFFVSFLFSSGVVCPRYGYCTEGATEVQACPTSEYNPFEGGTAATDCRPCLAGLYCNNDAGKVVVEKCQAGYYCPQGSSSPTAHAAPKGSYAPEGSEKQIPCSPGTWSEKEGQAKCEPCPAGKYCDKHVCCYNWHLTQLAYSDRTKKIINKRPAYLSKFYQFFLISQTPFKKLSSLRIILYSAINPFIEY